MLYWAGMLGLAWLWLKVGNDWFWIIIWSVVVLGCAIRWLASVSDAAPIQNYQRPTNHVDDDRSTDDDDFADHHDQRRQEIDQENERFWNDVAQEEEDNRRDRYR